MTEPAIYLGAILGVLLLVSLGAILSAWWSERRRRQSYSRRVRGEIRERTREVG